MLPKSFKRYCNEEFPVPFEIRRLARIATFDLWNGPVGDENDEEGFTYPGFETAVKTLREWSTDQLSDVWLNTGTEEVCAEEPNFILTDEETGETFDKSADWCIVDVKEVKRAIFGKELAEYI